MQQLRCTKPCGTHCSHITVCHARHLPADLCHDIFPALLCHLPPLQLVFALVSVGAIILTVNVVRFDAACHSALAVVC